MDVQINTSVIPRPDVRGIAIVMRNGKIVGKVPLATPLPYGPTGAEREQAKGDEAEASDEMPRAEDPF
jgi:hypothetical protein